MRRRLALALATCIALSACAPTFDWRDSRPEGSRARLMFPCRPASHARSVALAATTVEMRMVACSAGDTVFALTFADLKDPARVGMALDELGLALRSHLHSPEGAASQAVAVPGMTPNPLAVQWTLTGQLPDGRTVQERAALFSYGTVVYQATMLGPRLDAEAQDTFFGALRVGP